MKKLNKLISIAGARGKAPSPPTPHEPYDTPEGALYIGYIPEGKESLFSQEELDMFAKLEGYYVGIPSTDPYIQTPRVSIIPAESSNDPSAKEVFRGAHELVSANDTYASPSNFRTFSDADAAYYKLAGQDSRLGGVKRAVSVTEIKTLDLVGEGEIEGLSSGEYTFVPKPLGQIGYASSSFKTNQSVNLNNKEYTYLQSVYYNQTPVIDQEGKFNFQQVDINFTPGLPNPGIGIEDITSHPLQVVRKIGERIRGPNTRTGSPNEEKQAYYFSKFYKILNRSCDAIKLLIRLDGAFETINDASKRFEPVNPGEGSGDTIPIQLGFEVSFRRVFANRTPERFSLPYRFTIVAKLTNGFIYEYRFPFYKTVQDLENSDFQGFEIKVTRVTPDATVRAKNNRSTIDSIVEIYSQKFTYPNSAIVSSKFVADFFSNIPKRTYDVRLLKVKIPTNYDPILKTYDGDWDGTFKDDKYWTDNPAWCYYDLLTSRRYGLGKYIKEEDIDKWSLYELAKYCDVMVSDGEGGAEARYVINAYITERSEAFDALKNFSSVFRGLTYFMAGSIFSTYDSVKDPIYTFSNSNIKDGGFSYQGSSSQSRGNVFLVRFNDKNNFYEPAIEYLEDSLSIKRNGVVEKQISAFGCVKKSYALRYAEWMKQTENTETETVSFTAGLEGMLLKPGDVINVQDRSRSSKRLGGKIFDLRNSGAQNVSSVTLDARIHFSGGVNYVLSLITPTFNLDPSFITTGITSGFRSTDIPDIRRPHIQNKIFTNDSVNYITGEEGEEKTKIYFNSSFDETNYLISGRNVFSITCDDPIDSNPPKQFRIINIKEESPTEYGIMALEYNGKKYDLIDSGVPLSEDSTLAPSAPLSITLENDSLMLKGEMQINKISYFIEPPSNVERLVGYTVYAKDGVWTASDFTEAQSLTVSNKPPNNKYLIDNFLVQSVLKNQVTEKRSFIPESNSTYYFRAYSTNKKGLVSASPASGSITTANIQDLITYFSVNSLIPTDQLFYAQASGGGLPYISEGQRLIDMLSGNVGIDYAAKKLLKGPGYISNYTNEALILAKEPSLTWQFGIPLPEGNEESVSIEDQGVSFRLTAREPSPTNLPSKYIYFEITGHGAGAQALGGDKAANEITIPFALNTGGRVRDSSFNRESGQYPVVSNSSYKFPTATQLAGNNKTFYAQFSGDYFSGNSGPFRNYDVVVEAVSRNNCSSVGYFITGKEKIVGNNWSSNSKDLPNINKGYDIIEVRNPKPAQTICTPSFRLSQGKASIPDGDNADPKKKNSFFSVYNPKESQKPEYKLSDELADNYATLPILGADNSEATFCVTDQYFNQDGTLSFVVKRDSRGFIQPLQMIDYRDASVLVIYVSDRWFNSKNLKNRSWGSSADEEGIFTSDLYEEKIPITKFIKANSTTSNLDATNSVAYQARISAKVIDLRDTVFTQGGRFDLKVDILKKKYVSFAFLDAIEVGAYKIQEAADPARAIINDSKSYNISPAVLTLVRGEADPKSAFRAYFKFSILLNASNPPSVGGDETPFYSQWYGNGLTMLSNVTVSWAPTSIEAEIFAFGSSASVILIASSNALDYTLSFLLDEPLPTESRIHITQGNCIAGTATEDTISVVITLDKLIFAYPKSYVSYSYNWWFFNNSNPIPAAKAAMIQKGYSNGEGGIEYKLVYGIGMICNGQRDGAVLYSNIE